MLCDPEIVAQTSREDYLHQDKKKSSFEEMSKHFRVVSEIQELKLKVASS